METMGKVKRTHARGGATLVSSPSSATPEQHKGARASSSVPANGSAPKKTMLRKASDEWQQKQRTRMAVKEVLQETDPASTRFTTRPLAAADVDALNVAFGELDAQLEKLRRVSGEEDSKWMNYASAGNLQMNDRCQCSSIIVELPALASCAST